MKKQYAKKLWSLLTAFYVLFTGCAIQQLASLTEPYYGTRIMMLAPQKSGYHFREASHSDTDYLIFNDNKKTAFAQCFRLGWAYDKFDATQIIDLVTKRAVEEHSQNMTRLANFDYKVSDVVIGVANCKRIDFYGEYRQENIIGYDIHCIHPEFVNSVYTYVVRIGANSTISKNQHTELPLELKNFYKQVEFITSEDP